MIVVLFSKVWTIIFLTFDVIEWYFLNEIFSIPGSSSFYFRVFFCLTFFPFLDILPYSLTWIGGIYNGITYPGQGIGQDVKEWRLISANSSVVGIDDIDYLFSLWPIQ